MNEIISRRSLFSDNNGQILIGAEIGINVNNSNIFLWMQWPGSGSSRCSAPIVTAKSIYTIQEQLRDGTGNPEELLQERTAIFAMDTSKIISQQEILMRFGDCTDELLAMIRGQMILHGINPSCLDGDDFGDFAAF